MNQKLRVLFERALEVEPVPPTGELAREAMAGGAALRRRRRLVTGGTAACLVTIAAVLVALNLTPTSREPVPPVVAAGALMPSADATCERQ
ncbi:hypothetical protein PVK74_19975 [Micromonospora chalcea]|nr:hypothetical protein [Micromonospora chalcea]WDP98169.1 hypothetical protein PVK74_19975 [Micromonospora chalcea]